MLNPFFPGASAGGGGEGGGAPFQFDGFLNQSIFRQGDAVQIDLKDSITPSPGVGFPSDLVFTVVGAPQGFPPGFDVSPEGVIDTTLPYGPDESYYGSFSFNVSITSDLLEHEEIGNITITIERPVIEFSIADPQGFVLPFGEAISINLDVFYNVSGSNETPVYSISGSLPPGLSFDEEAGTITGEATGVGSYVVEITATLPLSTIDSVLPIPFTVPSPVLSTEGLDPVFYEQNVSLSLLLNGLVLVDGAASTGLEVTYQLHPDSVLPPGLSLGASGLTPGEPIQYTILGTPTGLHPDGQFATVVIRATYEGASVDIPVFFCDISLDRDATVSGGTQNDYTWGGFNFRRHTFNTSDTFTVIEGGWLDYAVVGGGGPGGAAVANNGGGGGAGAYPRTGRAWFPAGTYTVTIGAGGAPGSASGGSTTVSGTGINTLTGFGGPAGATAVSATTGAGSASSGITSTGGAAAGTSSGASAGTAGPSGGSPGGNSLSNATGGTPGGGGGFGGRGTTPTLTGHSGHGGGGLRLIFAAITFLLCCGGGGGARNGGTAGISGSDGQGSGGAGGATSTAGQAGQANRGNGGGGGGGGPTPGAGGAGGSGIVMLWGRRPT